MHRPLMIFAALIPLAILLGVLLATPLDPTTLMLVGVTFMIMLSPILIRHHLVLLIFSWGAYMNAFFLPGQPSLWLVAAGVSLFFSVLTRTLNREATKFLHVPSLAWALICFSIVVVVTAQLTGGLGLRALGSEIYGGKRYIFLIGAVVVYFALVSKPIEKEKRKFYALLFFTTSVTAIISNIAYTMGPSFYFLFLLFPADWAMGQAYADVVGPVGNTLTRIQGLSPACTAISSYLLIKYGLDGVLDLRKPHRLLFFLLSLLGGLYSGFRSHLVVVGLLILSMFFLQKLYRTRLLPLGVVTCIVAFGFLAVFSDTLPLTVQRSLAVLPVKLDPVAVQDAKMSSEWRVDMWRIVLQEMPKYLIVGKGYALNPTDIFLTDEAVRRGQIGNYESALIAGDYHNGPLSVIMTFGIFGTLIFVWVLIAGGRILWKNYRYGEPEIANINTFLMAYFISRTIFFLAIFGSIQTDFFLFTGVFGFSIALNGGVRKREDLERQETEMELEQVQEAEPPYSFGRRRPELLEV